MRKRTFLLLAIVLLGTTACTKPSPKPGQQIIGADTAAAKQLSVILEQDPSLQQLQKAGYSPVAVITNGIRRIVTYHLCGGLAAQECSSTRPDATHPVVALLTSQPGLDDPIIFTGEFRLIYAAPAKLQLLPGAKVDDYKLYCKLLPLAAPDPKQALAAGYIGQFAAVGNHFAALEYSVQKGKTMTHTLPNKDGSSWECTATTGIA